MGDCDCLVWCHSTNGRYSTKFGYQKWIMTSNLESGVLAFGDAKLWRRMWLLHIAPKVKQFMWCFLRDSLATGATFREKYSRLVKVALLWISGISYSYFG